MTELLFTRAHVLLAVICVHKVFLDRLAEGGRIRPVSRYRPDDLVR